MAKEFTLPDPGEGIHEAEVIEVRVSDGDRVSEGDTLFIVETDKAETDVPAPFSGTVEEVRVGEGDDIRVGEVLLTYSEGSQEAGEQGERGEEPEETQEREGGKERRKDDAESEEPAEEDRDEEGEEGKGEDEEAKETRDREDEAPEDEEGEEAKEEKKKKAKAEGESEREERDEQPSGDQEGREGAEPGRGEPVPATPSTRRLARELEVDIDQLRAGREDGRITDDDVRAAAGEAPEGGRERERGEEPLPPSRWPLTPRRAELPDFSRWGEVERVPLRSVRRATAQRMALAWSQVPHVTHQDVADITELEQLRRQLAPELEERGVALTLTTFVLKAVVAALKEFPRFNSSLDPEAGEVVLKRYYHIGVAVASERGLLVPVIRDVDRKNVAELAEELSRLAERTRDGELDLEEMRGGTFSVTNPGGIGGTAFTPIVNFPQVAILGCARARLEPVASGDIGSARVDHRYRLPLCLGFDHRVNDGADAAHFVNFVRELLEDPESFTLAV